MISKFYEINKFKKKINFFLFYGENEGQKLEAIQTNFSDFTKKIHSNITKKILFKINSFCLKIFSQNHFSKMINW